MGTREFNDQDGRRWTVWAVRPTLSERRYGAADDRPLPRPERRRRDSRRAMVGPEFANGWLTCETTGEKRRIAPIPPDWEALTDEALGLLCQSARRARAPRAVSD